MAISMAFWPLWGLIEGQTRANGHRIAVLPPRIDVYASINPLDRQTKHVLPTLALHAHEHGPE